MTRQVFDSSAKDTRAETIRWITEVRRDAATMRAADGEPGPIMGEFEQRADELEERIGAHDERRKRAIRQAPRDRRARLRRHFREAELRLPFLLVEGLVLSWLAGGKQGWSTTELYIDPSLLERARAHEAADALLAQLEECATRERGRDDKTLAAWIEETRAVLRASGAEQAELLARALVHAFARCSAGDRPLLTLVPPPLIERPPPRQLPALHAINPHAPPARAPIGATSGFRALRRAAMAG